MSIVATIPAEYADAANADLVEAGHGACFSVALANTSGASSPTHFGFHSFNNAGLLECIQNLDYHGLEITHTASNDVIFNGHIQALGLIIYREPETDTEGNI